MKLDRSRSYTHTHTPIPPFPFLLTFYSRIVLYRRVYNPAYHIIVSLRLAGSLGCQVAPVYILDLTTLAYPGKQVGR